MCSFFVTFWHMLFACPRVIRNLYSALTKPPTPPIHPFLITVAPLAAITM